MTRALPFQSEWTLVKVTVTQATVTETEVKHSRITDKATAMRRGLMVVDAISNCVRVEIYCDGRYITEVP